MIIRSTFLVLLFSFFHNDVAISSEDFQSELAIICKQEKIAREEENIDVLNQYLEAIDDQDEATIFDVLIEISLKKKLIEGLRKEVKDQFSKSLPLDLQHLQSDAFLERNKPGYKRLYSQMCDTPCEPMKQAKIDDLETPSALCQTVYNENIPLHLSGKVSLKKLDDPIQHRNFLFEAINKAKQNILITSYKFRDDKELIEALQVAVTKRVKVYLYYYDSSVEETKLKYLEKMGLNLRCINIHSKILAVDNEFVTIGS